MTPAEYWARIRQLPLYREREAEDGTAFQYRTNDGSPVRIEKPEPFSEEKRREMIEFYESMYRAAN